MNLEDYTKQVELADASLKDLLYAVKRYREILRIAIEMRSEFAARTAHRETLRAERDDARQEVETLRQQLSGV